LTLRTVFECRVKPGSRPIMSVGLKIGGHVYSRQLRVLTQEFTLMTTEIASYGHAVIKVVTLQDLAGIRPQCVIQSGQTQLRSSLKLAKDFTFYCNQFIDMPEGEYQF